MLFTSDHGYTLGGFRVDSHKMQVYDHVTRVPLLLHVPGGSSKEIDIPVAMVDVAPSLLAIAAGGPVGHEASTMDTDPGSDAGSDADADADAMDGISFAAHVAPARAAGSISDAPPVWPRDAGSFTMMASTTLN